MARLVEVPERQVELAAGHRLRRRATQHHTVFYSYIYQYSNPIKFSNPIKLDLLNWKRVVCFTFETVLVRDLLEFTS